MGDTTRIDLVNCNFGLLTHLIVVPLKDTVNDLNESTILLAIVTCSAFYNSINTDLRI